MLWTRQTAKILRAKGSCDSAIVESKFVDLGPFGSVVAFVVSQLVGCRACPFVGGGLVETTKGCPIPLKFAEGHPFQFLFRSETQVFPGPYQPTLRSQSHFVWATMAGGTMAGQSMTRLGNTHDRSASGGNLQCGSRWAQQHSHR